jgi:PIN domain nuclease of toxin-antitoxin system
MRVLLDTQAFLIAVTDGITALPKRVVPLLMQDGTERCISSATVMEIAIKNSIGKLKMGEAEMRQGVIDLRLTILPFTPRHAYRMFDLPLHHRDPFDRLLIATALTEHLPLLGGDREFHQYKGLKIVW